MCIEDHFPYICYRGYRRKTIETTFCKNSEDYETCHIVTQYLHPPFTEFRRKPRRRPEPSASSSSANERDRNVSKPQRQYSRDKRTKEEDWDAQPAITKGTKKVRFDMSQPETVHSSDTYHRREELQRTRATTGSATEDESTPSSRSRNASQSGRLGGRRGTDSGYRTWTYR